MVPEVVDGVVEDEDVVDVDGFVPGSSVYDITDIEINAFVVPKTCTSEYGTELKAGSKCLEIYMTFDSTSGELSEADLILMSMEVESTIESGVFAEEMLADTGLEATVIVPLPPALATNAPSTIAPTEEPTSDGTTFEPTKATDAPTEGPTTEEATAPPTIAKLPTIEPTITFVDLCPDLDTCSDCVEEVGCLWCLEDEVCYNVDPKIAEISASTSSISKKKKKQRQLQQQQLRFLQSDEEVDEDPFLSCQGLTTSSSTACVIPTTAPSVKVTESPTKVPTTAPDPTSSPTYGPSEAFVAAGDPPSIVEAKSSDGGSSLSSLSSSLMNTILSGICMTMLLFYIAI